MKGTNLNNKVYFNFEKVRFRYKLTSYLYRDSVRKINREAKAPIFKRWIEQ